LGSLSESSGGRVGHSGRRRGPRPSSRARVGAVLALVAFLVAPLVMYRLVGFPSFPRLTTWAAFRSFLSHADDSTFGNAVLLWAERVVVVLYLWLVTELPAGTGQQELQVASPLSVSVTEPPRRRFSIRGSSNNGTKSHGRQFGLFGPKRCAAA